MSLFFSILAAGALGAAQQVVAPGTASNIQEPIPEAILADKLPDQFLRPDAEEIDIDEDRLKRMTVPVMIESDIDEDENEDLSAAIINNGPFEFIIDTASQRTILSNEIAKRLALEVEDEVTVIALAGETVVQTVFVPELTLGKRSYAGLVAPTFRAGSIGADGVLGLDGLQGQRILFDFINRKITVEDASEKRKARSVREIVVTARRRSGQLIFTKATIQGVKTSVIIDTGGELSIGNKALQKRLRLRDSALQEIQLADVTGATVPANYGIAKELRIGRAQFGVIPIAFSDIDPFRALKLENKPAMFLGMNALRNFERIAIDFANRKIYFLLPKGA